MKTEIAIVLLAVLHFEHRVSADFSTVSAVGLAVFSTHSVAAEAQRRNYAKQQEESVGPYMSPIKIEPEPADLIECTRHLLSPLSNYSHWMMSVGDKYVIHVAREVDSNVWNGFANVTWETFLDVAGPSYCRINNLISSATKRNLSPLPIGKALINAWGMVGKTVTFRLLCANCEHYATEWKYGTGFSDQVSSY